MAESPEPPAFAERLAELHAAIGEASNVFPGAFWPPNTGNRVRSDGQIRKLTDAQLAFTRFAYERTKAILALVEAAKGAECFRPDESIEGAYRCGECDGCRIRGALEDLNGV